MKLLLGLFLSLECSFIPREEASNFLKREKRANSMFRFEERLEGKFEQECVEENCSSEELFEVFDDQDIYKVSWARYNQCKDVISKASDVIDRAPILNVDIENPENQKALLRRCMLTDESQLAPLIEEMRLNLEDEDFKAWVGKVFGTLASGSANMGQAAYENLGKVFAAINEGLQDLEWENIFSDAKTFGRQLMERVNKYFGEGFSSRMETEAEKYNDNFNKVLDMAN